MIGNYKQLKLGDRITIEQGLNLGKTFTDTSASIKKDLSTIVKEVKSIAPR